ncbi:hypothetical protein COCMIDRAFT_99487 [Bipolaris oryzae ATCC 44560]|uniref:AB hydrolase-1 domain-containing protein n=1 Tax=Bipolaris oryzae ATCC 44560 TaxID=930090 RepID=W6ZK21_COCMI|nr:uncharacterized protein COCMIDRAFT_99487 [Bipolaris oryzae ATCC 44560]EUC43941.1 hypothetical protein COCMIDRAFT_99487 [Bipolaris oryzae ATCC 44560]
MDAHDALRSPAANEAANQTLRSRRRNSLPLSIKTSDPRPAQRSSHYIRNAATSPQIISSLIDQLSAISIPANNHFENLLVGYDSAPAPSAAPSPRAHSHSDKTSIATGYDGASADHASLRNQNHIDSDDACEPPVIRTSKPPSGKSPLTAPKKASKPHSLSNYLARSGSSSCSLQSIHSNRSASSFGNISIEAGPTRQVSIGSNRSSVESKRSVKAHKSLMYMSSRERLRQKETERKRATVHGFDDISTTDSPRKNTTHLFPYEDTIKEEPLSARDDLDLDDLDDDPSRFVPRYPSTRRVRLNLVDGPYGESPAEKGLIPKRGSSLRHTASPTRKSRKHRSEENSRPKSSAATTAVIVTKPSGHKHSSSVTDESSSRLTLPSRAASEEPITRHRSMLISPMPDSHSAQLHRKRTGAKKRWSHPDLPAKAEKAHNDRIERKEESARAAAVQTPPQPIIEERPASRDSIDLDVNKYLDSERLSQKIRHPQTGRIISFSEVGDPQGFAVFVCVGMGLTRYVMAFYDQLAATLKLRLITPDRPGIGASQVDPNGTPLSWPDDVLIICQALKINKFSILAHSAGAVYALATSLRMPQHIRGKVHLLAPWIPPSQMAPIGISQDSPPTQQLPRSQRFLRALPPSLLKVANSTFLSATSASLQRTGPKTAPKTRRKSIVPSPVPSQTATRPPLKDTHRHSMMMMDQVLPNASTLTLANSPCQNDEEVQRMQEMLSIAERERQRAFDERLTFAIWDRATANANPATDLIVCLETKQSIGFRYEDINRPVVIHHGSKDSRVPVDNVRWLGKLMRKCEVRILEGEQHGLMASAQVMGNVLTEMASDWEDWNNATRYSSDRTVSRRRTTEKLKTQVSFTN